MRASLVIATLGLTAIAPAQNWYIPNNSPTTGVCTVIPFASIVGSNFAQCKYQTRFTAADLGESPTSSPASASPPAAPGARTTT
jgi:hypothetical protein